MVVSKTEMPSPDKALKGREQAVMDQVSNVHAVTKQQMKPPFPPGTEMAIFGMGCFWGAERKFWQKDGVLSTQVGYTAGFTKNPTYDEVCTGDTGHAEVVRIVFDPRLVTYEDLLNVFWENHDPTQGMRQDINIGTQYRSGIYYCSDTQREIALSTQAAYQAVLKDHDLGEITTEMEAVGDFFYAEDYHQQYLHKNPGGYCGSGGTGVACPRGIGKKIKSHAIKQAASTE